MAEQDKDCSQLKIHGGKHAARELLPPTGDPTRQPPALRRESCTSPGLRKKLEWEKVKWNKTIAILKSLQSLRNEAICSNDWS
jgi:hypothetical protein